jgi:hypothetical protein
MNFDARIPVFFTLLGYNLPAMIVIIIGMVWTHMTWQRHPPAARWTMIAFVWTFITYVLAILWHSFGILFLLHNELPIVETPYILALSGCEALGYFLFMVAFNTARYPYRPPQYYDHFAEDDDRPLIS